MNSARLPHISATRSPGRMPAAPSVPAKRAAMRRRFGKTPAHVAGREQRLAAITARLPLQHRRQRALGRRERGQDIGDVHRRFFFARLFAALCALFRCARSADGCGPCRLRHQRQDAQRAAAAFLDLERRRDDDRAGRRQQIKIGQALQAEAAGAVHVVMTRVGRLEVKGLSGIGADRLRTEAQNLTLIDQEIARPRVSGPGVCWPVSSMF